MDSAPRKVIVGWQGTSLEPVKHTRPAREIPGPAGAVSENLPAARFARLPIAAPVVAIVLEELVVPGVDTVHRRGLAGERTEQTAPPRTAGHPPEAWRHPL